MYSCILHHRLYLHELYVQTLCLVRAIKCFAEMSHVIISHERFWPSATYVKYLIFFRVDYKNIG